MIEKYYCFAGVQVAVSMPRERMYQQDGVLAPFRAADAAQPHRFRFQVVEQLSPPEGEQRAALPGFRVYGREDMTQRYIGSVQQGWENAYLRAEHQGRCHDVQLKASQFPGRVGINVVLNAMEIEHLIVREQGVILHASYIDWKGKAILFTAPSGMGKSTQAELWRANRRADIINGDRAVLMMKKGSVFASGIPFSGSSRYCENRSLPLAGIIYLGQWGRTAIRQIRGAAAFRRIWEGCSVNTWDRTDVELAMETVQRVTEQIPVYQLDCTPDESAVIALERMLRE